MENIKSIAQSAEIFIQENKGNDFVKEKIKKDLIICRSSKKGTIERETDKNIHC